jgi:hypothetical protein
LLHGPKRKWKRRRSEDLSLERKLHFSHCMEGGKEGEGSGLRKGC